MARMKGYIRGSRRGVWHVPLRHGTNGAIHAYCGWSFIKPERSDVLAGRPVCQKCTARLNG